MTGATHISEPAAAIHAADKTAGHRAWAALAAGSLATAGIFAALLAFSRLPGIQSVFPWPVAFFGKGLVIHVVFSLIVWLLTVFALLTSLATAQLAPEGARFNWLGSLGALLTAAAFPMLFIPAFTDAEPSLNDYIPVIQHPVYLAGLAVLGLGILLPALRLLFNLRGGYNALPPLAAAMSAGSVVYIMALAAFIWAARTYWGEPLSLTINEQLFWGGGHLLQFLFCLLMLTGWFVLSRASLGETAIDPSIFRLAVLMLALLVMPAPLLLRIFGVDTAEYRQSFSLLQFGMVLPSLITGVPVIAAILRARAAGPLPWRNTAFVALMLSLIVFATGGLMGYVVTGSDTRTPAHYHGVITGVNLALMGLILTYCLPRLGRAIPCGRGVRTFIWLYGTGTLVSITGMFWAGGSGAARKMPSAISDLADGAVLGMFVNGLGALVAVAGGVMFVVTLIRALSRRAHTLVPEV
jgi:cytochrome c oxidase subunit 1